MQSGLFSQRLPGWLPKLAATTVVCWALGANTYFDNAILAPALPGDAETVVEVSVPVQDGYAHSLSPEDAGLYRIIFAAQEKSEWNTADSALARLGDKRLVGEVLVDRYRRRPASLAELQDWLSHYSDLPEASEVYARAVKLAGKNVKIVPPPVANGWSGADAYGNSVGFRTAATDRKSSLAAIRFASKINRLIVKGDSVAAETLLESERHHRAMPAREAAHAEGVIAASYFYQGNIAHARRIANAGSRQQNTLALWINGLSAWKQNDMRAAGDSFALLATQADLSPWDRATAQFWAWRALKRAGSENNARFWLAQAARQPHSFYGLMAAHLLGADKSWSWDSPPLDQQQIALIADEKAGNRALALLAVRQRGFAENELRHVNLQGRRDLQEATLALATAEHMPSLLLQLGGMATKADGSLYDAALYPVPPWQPADGFKIDRALMYALIRHESQFDPTAVSDRGACGLMQLLPTTAKLMADQSNGATIAAKDCSGLLDPTVNIGLGQKYVRHLASQPLVGDNLMLLLAAYNEGPGKLAHGMRDDREAQARGISNHSEYEKSDPLFFLESLPVRQTHDYIEQVLIHYWGYRARLGEPENSLAQLAHGEWPRYVPSSKPQRLPPNMRDAALPQGSVMVASTVGSNHQ